MLGASPNGIHIILKTYKFGAGFCEK